LRGEGGTEGENVGGEAAVSWRAGAVEAVVKICLRRGSWLGVCCERLEEQRRGCPVKGEEKKSKGAVWFVFGWEEDQRTGGGSSWWTQLGEKEKNQSWGGGRPLREDKFRSFLGFFLFCVVSF
jgi:hypothetical protein